MRIIYYSQTFFSDCDFPLIRELQRKGVNVRYYMPLTEENKGQALLNISHLKRRFGIFRASEYPEMKMWSNYINLDNIFFINIPDGKPILYHKLFWRWVLFSMYLYRVDVFHFTWQLRGWERLLAKLPCKKVMTVHDPLSHSSRESKQEEEERVFSFSKADHFVLLNNVQVSSFINKYKISSNRVSLAKLGEFNHLRFIKADKSEYAKPYILYFGQISSYKGIEYLCEAMLDVHNSFPNVDLVIAGRGELYFDYSPYEKLSYFHLKNEYLSLSDIATLLHHSLFSVCPYKEATQSGVVQTSFSCNIPMIVTNVGALPESVIDGVTGLVVAPSDSSELSLAIKRLLSEPQLLGIFKENIEKVWRPTVDWESISTQYIDTWNQI